MRKTVKNPEFYANPVVRLLKNSIELQANTACIRKAHFMEIKTVRYN